MHDGNPSAAAERIEAQGADEAPTLKIAQTIDVAECSHAVHACEGSDRVGILLEVDKSIAVRPGQVLELSMPTGMARAIGIDLLKLSGGQERPAFKVGLEVLMEIARSPHEVPADRVAAARALLERDDLIVTCTR